MSPAELLERALAKVSAERLAEVTAAMVEVPSPTGHERPLAERLANWMEDAGIDSHLQLLDAEQANAWGRIRGDRSGMDLMLYAPIDTWSTGDEAVDVPWVGPRLRPDLRPRAQVTGDTLVGLGAMNPKGHAACNLVAAEALAAAVMDARRPASGDPAASSRVHPLRGDLIVAFGAGGMPTNAWDDRPRRNVGQGVGASFLLEQGVWADSAVITKSFWGVSRQEVGLAWLDVTVHGLHTYAGARHRLPYDNPIVTAARLVPAIEEWLLAWPELHRAGEVAPQGVVGAVQGGLDRIPTGVPASCKLRLDVRLAPGVSPLAARRSLAEHLAKHTGDAGQVDVELALAIPGSETSADAWIYRSAVAAWEAVEGRPHTPPTGQSGATDANILRGRGLPTVRVGLPKVHAGGRELDFSAGMNTVDVASMLRLTELLVRVAVDTCTRSREEIAP